MNPKTYRYSQEHEWVRLEPNGTALIGITEYAQDQLGDVVFLDLPPVGTQVEQSEKLGEIESVKAVAELFSPISGEVREINQAVLEHPELVNQEPYEGGWLVRLSLGDSSELERLLTAEEYEALVAKPAQEG